MKKIKFTQEQIDSLKTIDDAKLLATELRIELERMRHLAISAAESIINSSQKA